MKLYGLALLPNKELMNKLIKFQNENINFFKGPKLSLNSYLPHTSIIQCPFYEDKLNEELLDRVYSEWINLKHTDSKSTIKDLFYKQGGWYFLRVNRNNQLINLQEIALKYMIDLIDYKQINNSINQQLVQHNKNEQNNLLKYGYPYIGDSFIPHITLGRNEATNNFTIDDKLNEEYNNLFFNKPIEYSKIVFYKAGIDGALEKVICKKKINF